MSKNPLVITVVSLILILGFLFGVYSVTNKPQAPQSTEVNPEISKIAEGEHVKWSKENKRVLVEYSDLQCPACRNFHYFFKQIEAQGSADADIMNKVTFVYRHFPLLQVHPNAQAAAYATEAAGAQGKFFEMVDVLFENQDTWAKMRNPKGHFEEQAKNLGLDLEKYKKDFESKELRAKVDKDMQSALTAGANSTPTFFLDGRRVEATTFDEFKKLLKGN